MEFACSPTPVWILWVVELSLKNMQVQLTRNDMSMWMNGVFAALWWTDRQARVDFCLCAQQLLSQAPLMSNARGYNHSWSPTVA